MEDVFLKVGEMDEIDAPLQELQPKGLAALEISGTTSIAHMHRMRFRRSASLLRQTNTDS